MKEKPIWIRILYIIGVVSFIVGAIDPLEGSVLIVAGSFLIALTTFMAKDRHWKLFMILFVLIAIGVFFLFYLSSFGGFGEGALSWWWGLLVLSYPIGWLIAIILLIKRAFRKPKQDKAE